MLHLHLHHYHCLRPLQRAVPQNLHLSPLQGPHTSQLHFCALGPLRTQKAGSQSWHGSLSSIEKQKQKNSQIHLEGQLKNVLHVREEPKLAKAQQPCKYTATYLLLNVHQGPHSTCHILKNGAEPLAAVGKVDPAFGGLTRGWRGALRALPADSSHITCVHVNEGSHLSKDVNSQ